MTLNLAVWRSVMTSASVVVVERSVTERTGGEKLDNKYENYLIELQRSTQKLGACWGR